MIMFTFPLSPNSFTPLATAFKSFHSPALKIVGSAYTCKGSWIGNLKSHFEYLAKLISCCFSKRQIKCENKI